MNTLVANPTTQKYIRKVNENDYASMILRSHFEEYLMQWKKNTMFYSFSNQIIQDPYFQKILAMGKKAVPFIVAEIKNEPSTLVWALNIIYDTKISNIPETTIEEACRLWVKKLS